MCSLCQELQVEFAIRTPGELAKAIRVVQANVADGSLKVESPDRSSPIQDLKADGPWADIISYRFSCAQCGTHFELSAETYHGAGGSWRFRRRAV